MNRILISIVLLLICFQTIAQEVYYYNNIYNPENTFAAGRGILQIDDFYYGFFGTKFYPNSNYKVTVFKMDLAGDIVDWTTIGEDWHHYWMGDMGGILIETADGNLAFATHVSDTVYAHGVLIKLNLELDTLWKREYHSDLSSPRTWNVRQTADGGYIMVGIDYPGGTYYDGLLLKADSSGVEQWRHVYGVGTIYSEYLTNVIETPDGGYLIGGARKETEYLDHTLEAMVMKTDSLGNEEWTNIYGNPDVDDDQAHIAISNDGDFLVVTVYGEWVVSPQSRTGRIMLLKIDNEGNTIWQKKIGPKDRNVYLKHLRYTNDNNLIVSGWAYNDTVTDWIYEGLLYKFSQEGDSIWMRDYAYFNEQYDWNFFYDVYPTSDNGYIASGFAYQSMVGPENLWVVKVDSMGCDTPGCATGTFVINTDNIFTSKISVFPNPSNTSSITLQYLNTEHHENLELRCFNIHGEKMYSERIYQHQGESLIEVGGWPKGIYMVVVYSDFGPIGRAKIFVH